MLEISKNKRRFIAGASCPACKQKDKVVMYSSDEGAHFECVSCGHTEMLGNEALAQQVQSHAPTSSGETQDEIAVVKIVDASKG